MDTGNLMENGSDSLKTGTLSATKPIIPRYPRVKDEFATVDELLRGKSIARFGDGELKCAHGQGYVREPGSEQLAAELMRILREPHPNCLVGVPTMAKKGPKYLNWKRHRDRFAKVLNPQVQYYSAFITRPDSAPWINNIEFAEKIESLWRGNNVVVVSERKNSILAAVKMSAHSLDHIVCPHQEAYAMIDELEADILSLGRYYRDVVLLSCGPTATCLAHRLSAQGVQAIDIGSAGGFLGKLLRNRGIKHMGVQEG